VKIDKRALKEAVFDTALATPLNLMLNYIFLAVFLSWGWGAFQISVGMTVMFFMVAIVRKYYVRQYFKRGDSDVK
jgi:hypothetical protein